MHNKEGYTDLSARRRQANVWLRSDSVSLMMMLLSFLYVLRLAAVVTAWNTTSSAASTACNSTATRLFLDDEPNQNYFYSDCHMDFQVVITSPGTADNLTLIGPRLLVWLSTCKSTLIV
jgi:hypothetical protein